MRPQANFSFFFCITRSNEFLLGISYSVDAQELLVEPCLQDDQHLLESLAPDPILESDLLTLDDKTLKSELNDDLDLCSNEMAALNTQAVNNYINNLTENKMTKVNDAMDYQKVVTRQNNKPEIDPDDHLCMYIFIKNYLLVY